MKHKGISLFITIAIMLFCCLPQVFATDIYRLINPLGGASKSPNDGPPFLRYGSTQQYYHIETTYYDYHMSAVSGSFTSWNNAGSVQFTNSQSSGVTLTVYWDDTDPGPIVNPGKTDVLHNNFIIKQALHKYH